MRTVTLAVGITMAFGPALAGEEEVYGTWKLISDQRQIMETGEIVDSNPGASPQGYITYGKDGRMMTFLLRGVRPKPDNLAAMTDQQRADLFRSMVAYAGTYKFDGTTMEHHIDMSWNEVWTGTVQIRDVKRDGDRLIYKTRPAPFSSDGKMTVGILIWEKVK